MKVIIESGSIGVTEAAGMLEVNASTAQRLLATLVQDGFAAQGRDRKYTAGPALHSPGVWLPAHITSGGRALLADLSEDEVEARYSDMVTASRGQSDAIDMTSLRTQLADVRASRIAWNLEESEPGIAAMSISIGEFGSQRIAMSIALPISRFTTERGEKWSHDLIDIADAIAQGRS